MNFHETQLGRRFFDGQLPKLIQTLQEIAAALSRPVPTVHLEYAATEDILHDLYYGSYEPDIFKHRQHTDKALDHRIEQEEKALLAMITPEVIKQFERYQTAVSRRDSAVAEQAYKAGFRLAMNLFLAGSVQLRQSEHEKGDGNEPFL